MKRTHIKLFFPIIALAACFMVSCEDMWDRKVDGDGNRRIDYRNLQEFDRIIVNGDFEVQIDTADRYSAAIEADENLIELIETHVSGNTLVIEPRNGTSLRPTNPIEITLTTKALNELTVNGSGLAYCYGLETYELEMNLSGSGQIEMDNLVTTGTFIQLQGSGMINTDVTTENVIVKIEGSGELSIKGSSVNADYSIIGSGKIKASRLNTNVCSVYISGSGVADTWVNNALDVTIIGSGIVYYTGNPTIETSISGSGEVRER